MAEDRTPRDLSLVWVTLGTVVFGAVVVYIVQSVLP